MKEIIKGILFVGVLLCNLYFGLLFIMTAIAILVNLHHLGFAICVFIIMLIMGGMCSIIDSL